MILVTLFSSQILTKILTQEKKCFNSWDNVLKSKLPLFTTDLSTTHYLFGFESYWIQFDKSVQRLKQDKYVRTVTKYIIIPVLLKRLPNVIIIGSSLVV